MKRKLQRRIKKVWKRRRKAIIISFAVALSLVALWIHTVTMPKPINPTAFKPLLDLIARAESNNNYNAYFGEPANTSIDFTTMTLADVLKWQANFVAQGNSSSAVGRYQFIDTTLAGLVQKLHINTSAKFDASLQDRLAVALLEKRGLAAYLQGDITNEQFAANLAKEWAGLPKVVGDNPGESYYAGDGLNQSRVSVTEILSVATTFKQNALH